MKRKVLLIGWDAADWKVIRPLMAAGGMPNVQRLVETGASSEIATLHPPLSPMLWTSIATGKRPFKHGIHGFSEPTPDGRDVQPITNLSRTSKAIWNILSQSGLRSTVIGWWPSQPAEPINGVMVSDHYHRAYAPLEEGWPLQASAVHPPEIRDTLAGLRVHPEALTPAMVEPFIPRAREIDQDRDKRLAMFLKMLGECMTVHAAARWLLRHREWDFFAVYFDSIDHFSHGFMKYHPPRQSWIAEADFELYGNVVSEAYRMHDRMLGELMANAGADAMVILLSDHGFHPDHLRPASIPDIPAGPAIEHRDYGILAIGGPGIKNTALAYRPSVLDITPTVLTLFGLPVGEDMDGNVISGILASEPLASSIPSWEEVPGDDGRHPAHARLDPVAAQAALEQMVALGYIEPLDKDRESAVDRTVCDLRFNLAEAYQDDHRHLEAHEILSDLYARHPEEDRFAVRLFVSCQALGLREEMREIVEGLERIHSVAEPRPAVIDYLTAQLHIAAHRYEEASRVLERVTAAHLVRPGLLLEAADLCLRMRRWRQAQEVYEKAIEVDPDDVNAHVGFCKLRLRQKKFDSAAHAALDALERDSHHPLAHYLLGLALSGKKEYGPAAEAFRAAIANNPNFPQAHLRLASLLEQHFGNADAAREHRRRASRMRKGRPSIPAEVTHRAPAAANPPGPPLSVCKVETAPLAESIVVVTGLPRSGTSMVMQMLAAGGMSVLSDGLRQADEDNPRGYFEFEPAKNLSRDARWLHQAKGKVVKIVAPLLARLPGGLPCRVILCERNLDEVLDSQEGMLVRRNGSPTPPRRRGMLKDEYSRTLVRLQAMLARRPQTELFVLVHSDVLSQPLSAAQRLNHFLGGGLDIQKMAAVVDPDLHRNRSRASAMR